MDKSWNAVQRPVAGTNSDSVFDRPGPPNFGGRMGRFLQQQFIPRYCCSAGNILFQSLGGVALCSGVSIDRLLADQPVGSVAGAFSFAILCHQSFACFVCSRRFQHQVTDYVQTALLLLDRAQSLGFIASQFNRNLAASSNSYRNRSFCCNGILYHTQRLASHPLYTEAPLWAGRLSPSYSVLKKQYAPAAWIDFFAGRVDLVFWRCSSRWA